MPHFHINGLTVADHLGHGITVIWTVGVQVQGTGDSIVENAYFIDDSNVAFDPTEYYGASEMLLRAETAVLGSGGTHRIKFSNVSFANLENAIRYIFEFWKMQFTYAKKIK